jgi:O-antigen ligase
LPPTIWWAGLIIFGLTWLAAVLASGHFLLGLKYLVFRFYPIALIVPLAWLAFSQRPDSVSRLRLMWSLGLMIAAALTFREGGYQLICMRAKAHLGTISLGGVLGQLIPVMIASIFLSLSVGRRKEAAFFALALAAAGLALAQNCSRQTFLAAPLLAGLICWVYRCRFHRRLTWLAMFLAVVLILVGLTFAAGGAKRFTTMFENTGHNSLSSATLNRSDTARLTAQRHGWSVFLAHPLLGQGPGVWPVQKNPPPVEIKTFHAHNMFITVLAEAGLFGFLGFLALILAPLSLIWPHRHSRDPETFFWVWATLAVNLQFILNGLTDHLFGTKPVTYVHWIVTTAALWQISRKQESTMPQDK